MAWLAFFFAFAEPVSAQEDDLDDPAQPNPSQPNLAVPGEVPRDLISFSQRVWLDANIDAIVDPGEAAIPVVRVELFVDANADGWPDDTDGDSVITLADALAVTTTDADGRFTFSGLDPGTYIAGIPPSEWAAGAALNGLLPSSPSPCLCLDGYAFSTSGFGFWEPTIDVAIPTDVPDSEAMLPVTGTSVTDLIVYGIAMVLIGWQIAWLAAEARKLGGNPFRL